MPETKTPQKFPPEKGQKSVVSGLKPSLHPTDDEIIELNDEIYTANLDDQDKTAILLYRTAFEAGQKSGEEKLSRLEKQYEEDKQAYSELLGQVKSLEASLEKKLDKDVDRATKTKLYREYEKLKAELSASRATVKDRMKFENEQEKYIQKLKAELKTAKQQGKQELFKQIVDKGDLDGRD